MIIQKLNLIFFIEEEEVMKELVNYKKADKDLLEFFKN